MDTKLKGDIAEQAAAIDLFYVFPVEEFVSYGSEIHLVEDDKRQRKPRSVVHRNAWELITATFPVKPATTF